MLLRLAIIVCTIEGKGILWKGAISVEPSCFNDLHVLVMNRVFSAEVITPPTTVVPFLSVEAICLIQATGIVNP